MKEHIEQDHGIYYNRTLKDLFFDYFLCYYLILYNPNKKFHRKQYKYEDISNQQNCVEI